MRLEIRRRGVKVTEELRTYLKERLRLTLGRFARHIGLVRVYLRDVNGPRRGPGKKCRMVVELPPRGRVIVASVDTAISAAIARTASRAGFALKRHVHRRRARRRPPRRPARAVGMAAPFMHWHAGVPSRTSTGNGRLGGKPQKGGA
jgi:putative sigma-54 modulation protein